MTTDMPVLEFEFATHEGTVNTRRTGVARSARAIIEQHHYFRGRSAGFDFQECDSVLTVRGSVPSFYLKQLLQTTLRGVEGVSRVDNQVEVVCSFGLSSVRA